VFFNPRFAVTNTVKCKNVMETYFYIAYCCVSVFSKVLLIEVSYTPTMPSKDRAQRNRRKEINKSYYESNKEDILSDREEKYVKEIRSERHSEDYYKDVVTSRMKSAESSKLHYHKDVDKARIKSAESSQVHYQKDVDKARLKALQYIIKRNTLSKGC